ncbi:MAG: hypothetical protein MJZ26_05865 [Fibrobacter sp.]|nr:hypothetical protein [Fibrobacter sp.]
MKLQKNKGVALITVLLFMLVATIAATAVFKWIQAQNRASASQLKQNEAYQASQAGINAARSWLAYNGQETAALVTQFEREKTPILLDSMLTPLTSKMQQGYSVYLTNVDASNASDVKLKIVSVGKGRHNSVYSQVAILGVNGLYKVKVPVKISKASVPYNYSYFGGSTTFQGEHKGTAMLINGNWSGNPGELDEDFIVTGNVSLSGNKIEIGKTACIGGDMNTQNGSIVNDIYVGGKSVNMDISARGNAYFEGDVFEKSCWSWPGGSSCSYSVGAKSDTIAKNMTLNGTMGLNLQSHNFVVGGNLCLTNRGKIDFGTSTSKKFMAVGNVYIPSGTNALQPFEDWSDEADKRAGSRYLGGPGKDVYVATANVCKNSDRQKYRLSNCPTTYTLYDYEGNVSGQTKFSSDGNVTKSIPATAPFECAESVKEYCDSKWEKKAGGCDGSKYKIDDLLSAGYDQFKSFANKAKCTQNVLNSSTTEFDASAMSSCYTNQLNDADSNRANLYNEYMVVRFAGGSEDGAAKILGSVKGKLKGKFIFLFETQVNYNIYMPETTDDSYVFVYMKEGSTSEIWQGGSTGPWNYFFYLEKSVKKLTTSKDWNGSFYAAVGDGNCAKISQMDGGGKLNFDPELMQDMIDAGIICAYGEVCTPSTGSSTPGSGSGEESSGASDGYDNQWISYGPRVKINLASQYANTESFEYSELNPSLIVMPRLIYLAKDKKLYENGSYQYSVLYLGGAKNPSDEGTFAGDVSCYVGNKVEAGASIGKSDPFTKTGLHTCLYKEYVDGVQLSSYFWVWVVDESSSTVVSFPSASDEFECSEGGETKQIAVNIANSGNEGKLKVLVYNTTGSGIGISANSSYLSSKGAEGYTTTYEFNVPKATSIPDLFTMTMNDCENVTGFVQFQMVDDNAEDLVFVGSPSNLLYIFSGPEPNVQREEISQDMTLDAQVKDSLNKIPDCKDIDGGMIGEEVWSARTIESNPGGCKKRQSPSIGPWLCNAGETVDNMTAAGYDEDLCEVVQTNHPQVAGGKIMTYVYASLKARPLTLTIDVSGIKGRVTTDTVNTWHKESRTNVDDTEYEVAVIDEYGKELGVCRTGGAGQCKFTTYAGGTYHLLASSTNFSHYSVYCNSNATCTKTKWYYHKGIKRELVVVMKEDTKVRANFTRTGYCFTEDFKHLHSYCSYDVTPVAYAGGEELWLKNGKGGWVDKGSINGYLKNLDGSGTFNAVEATVHDYARGPQLDGSTAYCIDQCVTTKNYRYTGNKETGVPDAKFRFYPTICSVTGNKDIPENETAAYKEDQNKDYWSYWDPGEREYPSPKASNKHYACAVGKNASDPAIRDCDPETDPKHCIIDECKGPAPLDMPRVRGGYYRPDDPYSPWMRVLGVHMSQNVKSGPIIGQDIGSQWNTAPFVNRDQGYMTTGHNTTTPDVVMRKAAAGYNGTYSKIFKIMTNTASYSWGSGNTFIFRSNPSATSFYHATVIAGDQIEKYKNQGVSANETRGSHILVCYCTNETCPAYSPYDPPTSGEYSRGWGSAVNLASRFRETGKKPYNDYSNSNPGKGFKDFWNIDGGTDNLGHCAVAPVVTNIPFSELKDRVLELKVDLDEDTAFVTLAYSSDISNVAGVGISSYMVYSRASFNLNDPELFGFKKSLGYKEEETPMYKFKHNVNGAQDSAVYVGFSMHDPYEQVYNIEWRSGGNCDTKLNMRPQIYCGFENNVAPVNKTKMPVYYVYDYCPDGAECDCDYSFTLNGNPWYGTLSEVRNYSYGELAVSANCRVVRDGIDGATRTEEHVTGACNAFSTYDPSIENSCTETYNIFLQREVASKSDNFDYIDLNESRISSIDRTYAFADNKVSVSVSPNTSVDEASTATNISDLNMTITCGEGSCEYAKNWYLKDASYYSTTTTLGVKELDGVTYNYPRLQRNVNLAGTNFPKLLKLGFNVEGAWHNPDPSQKGLPNESGVDTLYLKLRSKLGTPYLNLRDADLSFDFIQSWNMDTVQYWLQDNLGNNSPVMNIETNYGKATEENRALYVGGDDGYGGYQPITVGTVPGAYGIPAECYSISRPNQSFDPAHCSDVEVDGKHYNCCQEGLAWWLDANGQNVFRRYSTGSMTSEWYKGVTPDFDVERVSKIFFRLVNRNEAGAGETDIRAESFNGDISETGTAAFVHVGNLKASCPNAFGLDNCRVNGVDAKDAAKKAVFNAGETVILTANVTKCKDAYITSSIDGLEGDTPECVGMTTLASSPATLPMEESDQDISLTVSSAMSNWMTKSCSQYIHVNPLKSNCTWVGTDAVNYLDDPATRDKHEVVYVNDGRNFQASKPKLGASFEGSLTTLRTSLYKNGGIFKNTAGNVENSNIEPYKTSNAFTKTFIPNGSGKYEFLYGTNGRSATNEHSGVIGDGNCYVDVVVEPVKISCSVAEDSKVATGGKNIIFSGTTNAHKDVANRYYKVTGPDGYTFTSGANPFNVVNVTEGANTFTYNGYKAPHDPGTYEVSVSFYNQPYESCGTFNVSSMAISNCNAPDVTYVDDGRNVGRPSYSVTLSNYGTSSKRGFYRDGIYFSDDGNVSSNSGVFAKNAYDPMGGLTTPESKYKTHEFTLLYGVGSRASQPTGEYATPTGCVQKVTIEPVTYTCQIDESSRFVKGNTSVTITGVTNAHRDVANRRLRITGPNGYSKILTDFNVTNVSEGANIITYKGYTVPATNGEYHVSMSLKDQPYVDCGTITVGTENLASKVSFALESDQIERSGYADRQMFNLASGQVVSVNKTTSKLTIGCWSGTPKNIKYQNCRNEIKTKTIPCNNWTPLDDIPEQCTVYVQADGNDIHMKFGAW